MPTVITPNGNQYPTAAAAAVDAPAGMAHRDAVRALLDLIRADYKPGSLIAHALTEIADTFAQLDTESLALGTTDSYLADQVAEYEAQRNEANRLATSAEHHATDCSDCSDPLGRELNHAAAANYRRSAAYYDGKAAAYRDARRVLDIARGI